MRDAASEVGVVQWAWRAAGVPWIGVSRWPSDDPAREAVVREMHRALRDGKEPDGALLAARQALQRNTAWAAPFYWAGWMAIGSR